MKNFNKYDLLIALAFVIYSILSIYLTRVCLSFPDSKKIVIVEKI